VFAVSGVYAEGLLYLGNGNGTFTLKNQVNIASEPFYVAAAELNSDGFLDIISSGSDALMGNGKGQFKAPVYYPVTSAGNAWYALPTDLRNDNRIDLVLLNFYPGISVLLNEGNGKYADGAPGPVSGGGGILRRIGGFQRRRHTRLGRGCE
jgi:hypothetical protein